MAKSEKFIRISQAFFYLVSIIAGIGVLYISAAILSNDMLPVPDFLYDVINYMIYIFGGAFNLCTKILIQFMPYEINMWLCTILLALFIVGLSICFVRCFIKNRVVGKGKKAIKIILLILIVICQASNIYVYATRSSINLVAIIVSSVIVLLWFIDLFVSCAMKTNKHS